MPFTTVKTKQVVSSSVPAPSALTSLLCSQSPSVHTSPTTALPLEILHNLRYQHGWTELCLHHAASTPDSSTRSALGRTTPVDSNALSPSISNLDLGNNQNSTCQSPKALNQHPTTSSQPSSKSRPTTTPSPTPSLFPTTLLSGQPPKPLYIHPDLQLKLLKAGVSPTSSRYLSEREWVLPTSLARKWTLRELCAVFDALPAREPIWIGGKGERSESKPLSRRTKEVFEDSGSDDDSETETETEADGEIEKGAGKSKVGPPKARVKKMAPRAQQQQQQNLHQDAKRVLLAMKAHDGRGGDGTIVYYVVQEGEVKPRQN